MGMTWGHRTTTASGIDRTGMSGRVRGAGILFVVALFSATGFSGIAAAQETEEAEPAVESPQIDDTVPLPEYRVVIDNRTAYPIAVIAYDDDDGSYSLHEEVPAGGALDERVVPGLLWLFKVNDQALVGQYATTDQPDQYVVLDDSTLSAAGYPPGPMDDSWRQFEEKDDEAAAPDATLDAAPNAAAAPAAEPPAAAGATAAPGSGG